MLKKFLLVFLLISLKGLDCYYFGYQSDPADINNERKKLEFLTNSLIKSELDEKNVDQPIYEENLVQMRQHLNWSLSNDILSKIGEVSGIAVSDFDNLLYIFHRGNRSWNENLDLDKISQPIPEDTVLIINITDSTLVKSWGKNLFYLPHGISIDNFGNVWLTDIVTHQVFRFRRNHFDAPELTLGEKFISGGDENHFCMPTDIAIASDGFVYISDGYCNSRILIYSPEGLFLEQIAFQDGINIPHSLTLLEDENLICVADREEKRILCYTAGLTEQKSGKLIFSVKNSLMKRVFAIDALDDLLFLVNGPDLVTESKKIKKKDDIIGVVLNLATERMINSFYPQEGFQSPHDLAINHHTKLLFVSDLKSPKKIFKFSIIKN